MKVFGLERDNTTLPSTTDPVGFPYSASFELYPFHEGQNYAVYKGILNGYGPRRGRFCAVKARLTHSDDATDWHVLQSLVRKADALASTFNKLVQVPAINFQWPLLAQMDTVSDFIPLIRLLMRHNKRLQMGETVIIEDFLQEPIQRFNSALGWACPDSKTDVTQAFSHYTWHVTRQLVVCDLQGVQEERGFRLTTPTIHSLLCQYGTQDRGVAGISEFFATHKCNSICSAWPGLDVPGVKMYATAPPRYNHQGGHPPPTPPSAHHHTPSVNHHGQLHVHYAAQRGQNPRRNSNNMAHTTPLAFVPKVPSAPTIETTRF